MKCGYFKVDITPSPGCRLMGYLRERIADKVADPLFVRAVAFQNEGTAIFLCFDLLGIRHAVNTEIREYVAQYVGCDRKDVFVSCTHTHTAPNIYSAFYPLETKFINELKHYAARAAQGALDDMKEATFAYTQSEVHDISFVRRYRMKDGTVQTNPGIGNPDILEPMNPGDDTLQLLRVTREEAGDVLLVNYQVHPDTMGGKSISADYPGVVCDTLERAIPGVKCLYLNGTAGDLNHYNVHAEDWVPNKGSYHVNHIGRAIAGQVLNIYDKARPIEAGPVKTAERETILKLKRPDQDMVARSKVIMEHYRNGEIEKIPGYHRNFDLTTVVFEANRAVQLAQMNGEQMVYVCGASLGDIALVGIPGEPFCEVGKQIRSASGFKAQFVMGQTNGMEGYFPTMDAFSVDGYESRTAIFEAGVAENLIDAGNALVKQLRG